ncbi:MAG TPA: bifunctional phosphoglucose/phosphomannose isomerase [Ignavibacteria bacterium]|nr:bifunctional phosphoglucose/phosphomannose isomerase [Ignavibacteria bacterium]
MNDNIDLKEIDRSNMYDILIDFPNQIKKAIQIGESAVLNSFDASGTDSIIICGMGGSAIGGDLLRSYTFYDSKIPVYVNRNYTLPAYAGKNTLVVISSYSGGTEETLSAYEEALRRGCKILCVSSGGTVEKRAKEKGSLLIKIPGGLQPRCALGYSFFVNYIVLSRLGFFTFDRNEFDNIIANITKKSRVFSDFKSNNNNALNIAKYLQHKLPVVYSSSDLLDVVNVRWRCQLNENSKLLAYGNFYPEMNHNEIVGWEQNEHILNKIVVIYLQDIDDLDRIRLRMNITEEIFEKHADSLIVLDGDGDTKLERILDLIYLGDWVSYHLAILENVDPTPVSVIGYLKDKLSKQ